MAQAARQHKKTGDGEAKRTRDHNTIRGWAEERGGRPAMVEGTEILRFDFGEPDEKLNPVEWEDFFRVFDDRDLEFLHQDPHSRGKRSAASTNSSTPELTASTGDTRAPRSLRPALG